jgi:DNA-binding CsgD family transcriptional regulator
MGRIPRTCTISDFTFAKSRRLTEVLQQLFGLTAREAAVLRALVQGETLPQTAQRLGIKLQTVKTHLQHIMQTMGAARQAELVKQVLSSPAWIAAQKSDEMSNSVRLPS